ncbi:MAG: PadR family transcriptional regulator [Terriglobales bacterium]
MGRDEIPPGSLVLLILKTLMRQQPLHGFEIAEAIRARSEDVLRVEEGSLYPALQRMLLKGWVVGEWGATAENRRARYYRLTAAGRRQLEREQAQFTRVMGAVAAVIGHRLSVAGGDEA